MKNTKRIKILSATIASAAVLAGSIGTVAYLTSKDVNSSEKKEETKISETGNTKETEATEAGNAEKADSTYIKASAEDMALKITDKDKDTTYEESEAELISLNDNTGTVRITEEGTYIVTGSTDNGMIIIEADPEKDDVHLVLRDAKITSQSSAAIYILSADEVYITLEGENVLGNGGTYEAIDENDIDSVIYSKEDLTINGSGSLAIDTDAGHAIVCKDDMVITGGTYNLTAKEDVINTNDSLAITDGNFTLKCGDDVIHTDGILQIDGGNCDLTGAEGLEGTYITINDGTFVINASDDGINASQKVEDYYATLIVNGGDITITMEEGDTDGIDSNGDLYINGGTIRIDGQSTIDYDGQAQKNGGVLIINGVETDTLPNQMPAGGMQDGMMPPDLKDGQIPEGMTPPDGQLPDGKTPPDGQSPDGSAFKEKKENLQGAS